MTLRRPTASTEETVTSFMVLTSCPASKFASASALIPSAHHCVVAPLVSPPAVCFSLSVSLLSVMLLVTAPPCPLFPAVPPPHTRLHPTLPRHHV